MNSNNQFSGVTKFEDIAGSAQQSARRLALGYCGFNITPRRSRNGFVPSAWLHVIDPTDFIRDALLECVAGMEINGVSQDVIDTVASQMSGRVKEAMELAAERAFKADRVRKLTPIPNVNQQYAGANGGETENSLYRRYIEHVPGVKEDCARAHSQQNESMAAANVDNSMAGEDHSF